MANIITVGEDTFDDLLKSQTPVMVDFWAVWCGPCKMLAPTVETLADENEGRLAVAKVNVDESPDLAAKFGIRGVPTLIFFKNGTEVKRIVGAQNKSQLQKVIDEVIG